MDDQFSDAVHLTDDDIAAYLDRRLAGDDQDRIEEHLAWCSECRVQLTTVSAILRRRPAARRRWVALGPAAAAAAAIILLVAIPDRAPVETGSPAHRDAPTAIAAPIPIGPEGIVQVAEVFVWHRLERADRYRVTLFEISGGVLWRTETADTVAVLADTVGLSSGATYLWRVDARVGIDRWVETELQQFSLEPDGNSPTAPSPAP